MSQPGWYPDPSGTPGPLRYWTGTAWSDATQPATSTAGSPSRPRWVLVLALVAVLMIGLAAWRAVSPGGLAGQDTNSAAPTVSAWDETSTASPSQDGESSNGTAVDCPGEDVGTRVGSDNGRLRAGHLSVPALGGGWRMLGEEPIPWLADSVAQTKTITSTWISLNAVGAASSSRWSSTRQAAEDITQCNVSIYGEGYTGSKTVSAGPVTVDGAPAYRIRSEVYVDDQGPNIPGDMVDVIVIDTGHAEAFGVYMGWATIGDSTTQHEVDSAIADLRVEK